ncbi:hypothetical protein AAY473_022493 [Plecturocebus cupreus]
MLQRGRKWDVYLSIWTYQREYKIEKGRPAVEENGQERSDSGEQQAHISAHNNPQRLQDLIRRESWISEPILMIKCLQPSIPIKSHQSTFYGTTEGDSKFNINTTSYRKKCLNVLVNKGSNILPVQNVSQPAILTTDMQLLSFVPSRFSIQDKENEERRIDSVLLCHQVGLECNGVVIAHYSLQLLSSKSCSVTQAEVSGVILALIASSTSWVQAFLLSQPPE